MARDVMILMRATSITRETFQALKWQCLDFHGPPLFVGVPFRTLEKFLCSNGISKQTIKVQFRTILQFLKMPHCFLNSILFSFNRTVLIVIWQKIQQILFLSFNKFSVNCVESGKYNSSSDDHLRNPKTSGGPVQTSG